MNREAEQHLVKAKEYADRGEQFYRMAAEHILAAREAGAKWTEINDGLGRGENYAERIAKWAEIPANEGARATPFAGESENARKAAGHAKTVLRDAPLEQVEQIISALPKERQQAVAAAAGSAYHKARQEYDEHEARLTPSERREREHAQDQIVRPVMQAVASFTTLGIIGHLEQATDELRELNADSSVTPDMTRKIERALDAFVTEFKFARALLGEEIE